MSAEPEHGQESDLERTDRLPIIEGVMLDPDVADDAVRLDHDAVSGSAMVATPSLVANNPADFVRPSIDLPSLAESVRSVEERIERQTAEYDALSRSYERARDTEAAAVARVAAMERDLEAVRAAWQSEQQRVLAHEETLTERNAWMETARAGLQEATRERDRVQTEARTLREALATRDATIAQVLHSLGERDAQLAALRQEHVDAVASLETRTRSGSQLEQDLAATRAESAARATELQAHHEKLQQLSTQMRRAEGELASLRGEAAQVRAQANSYLEVLSTREWRHGFDQNVFRDLDARAGAADATQGSMKGQRDQLQTQVANLEVSLAAQQATIDKLQSRIAGNEADLAQHAQSLSGTEQARAGIQEKLTAMEAEVKRLRTELTWTEKELTEARETADLDKQRGVQQIAATHKALAEQVALLEQRENEHSAEAELWQSERSAQLGQLFTQHKATVERLHTERDTSLAEVRADRDAQIARLKDDHAALVTRLTSEAETREQEMAGLLAHLQEARRPIDLVESEVKRLHDEIIAKDRSLEQSAEENRALAATLERTRGALEEREFLIRRLERSESNNANVLGRIQTSMERLSGGAAPAAASAAGQQESAGELIRVDGERQIAHTLGRRTRIGRAAGCEVQIVSSSVSRHHAMILAGPREAIIEDLNSTNGVIVNGRKVARTLLRDGDVILIGEIKFRYALNAAVRALEASAAGERSAEAE
jgi:chromosome segregation ATPase